MPQSRERRLAALAIAVLLVLAATVRMPFWLATTHIGGDPLLWQVWSRAIHQHGFINIFRSTDTNYVGYHYVLWPISAVYARISPDYELGTASLRMLLKLPAFVCDLALAPLIFFAARSLVPSGGPLRRTSFAALAAAAFVLAPATIYDSMWWGQIDSVVTVFMAASVFALGRGRVGTAWAAWMLGFLIKPQPIVILPVLAAATLWKFGPRELGRGAAVAAIAGVAALLPFLVHGDGRTIGQIYRDYSEQWPLDLSLGAWNGWSILDVRGDPHPSDALFHFGSIGVTYARLSIALSVAATIAVLAYVRHHLDLAGLLAASAAMVFTFFMLPTSTHDRYLYPMFALAAPLLVRMPRLTPVYALLAAGFFINLVGVNPPNGGDAWQWQGTWIELAVASANLVIYVSMLGLLLWSSVPRRHPLVAPDRAAVAA
jgi:dolichyl-phosphate-mannose-protein mannosyltransferase